MSNKMINFKAADLGAFVFEYVAENRESTMIRCSTFSDVTYISPEERIDEKTCNEQQCPGKHFKDQNNF